MSIVRNLSVFICCVCDFVGNQPLKQQKLVVRVQKSVRELLLLGQSARLAQLLDGKEAMQALEYADAIDRFNETLRSPITTEEIDAEIEEQRERLVQVEKRKALEFDVEPTEKSLPQAQAEKLQISDNDQKLLSYLKRKETTKSEPMGVDTVQKNGVIKEAKAPIIRELFAELVQAELAELDDNGNIFLPD